MTPESTLCAGRQRGDWARAAGRLGATPGGRGLSGALVVGRPRNLPWGRLCGVGAAAGGQIGSGGGAQEFRNNENPRRDEVNQTNAGEKRNCRGGWQGGRVLSSATRVQSCECVHECECMCVCLSV